MNEAVEIGRLYKAPGGHADWVLPLRKNFIDMLGGCDSSVLVGSWGNCNSCAKRSSLEIATDTPPFTLTVNS